MIATDPSPLIVTIELCQAAQATFNRLRTAHFPPQRNHLDAHLSLFHHLPGENIVDIRTTLDEAARAMAPIPLAVTGLVSLGRGVAFALASPDLLLLRSGLAAKWRDALTPQDRQGFRPHITIQNKVDPAAARALLAALSASFTPFDIEAIGLLLWRYRGGPWEAAGSFLFTCPRVDLPESHHR